MSSEYQRIVHPNGYRYIKKGKGFVAEKNVPQEVLDSFTDEKNSVSDKKCLFCGKDSRYSRMVNSKTVYICDDHYYDMGIGKIAQKLKEND